MDVDGPLQQLINDVCAFADACPERGYDGYFEGRVSRAQLPSNASVCRGCVAALCELESLLMLAASRCVLRDLRP